MRREVFAMLILHYNCVVAYFTLQLRCLGTMEGARLNESTFFHRLTIGGI